MKKKIKSIKNFRDLGYIDGVQKGRIIRSAHLKEVSEKDVVLLREEYHLHLILDLRTNTEIKEKPDQSIEGVEYCHLPIFSEKVAGISHEKNAIGIDDILSVPEMNLLYPKMLEGEQLENVAKAMRIIYEECQSGAVLFHCSEGKDRTGIISALLLSLAGVKKEVIMKDYILTNRVNKRKASFFFILVLLLKRNMSIAKKAYGLMVAKKEYLDGMFNVVEKNYSSTKELFIKGMGFSEEEVNNFVSLLQG